MGISCWEGSVEIISVDGKSLRERQMYFDTSRYRNNKTKLAAV